MAVASRMVCEDRAVFLVFLIHLTGSSLWAKNPAKHDAWQGFYFVQQAPTQEVVPNAVSSGHEGHGPPP